MRMFKIIDNSTKEEQLVKSMKEVVRRTGINYDTLRHNLIRQGKEEYIATKHTISIEHKKKVVITKYI